MGTTSAYGIGAFAIGFGAVLALQSACSANSGSDNDGATIPGGSGAASSGGSGAASSGASGGTMLSFGGSDQGGSGQGGQAGTIGFGGSGQGGLPGDSGCQSVGQVSDNKISPVDIIFAVDTSCSMGEEAVFVQNAINTFSNGIEQQSGLDYRVVMIAEEWETNLIGIVDGICVPAPLGSGNCPSDTNLPKFAHLLTTVASTNALQLLISEFPNYSQMLRPDSLKHVVVISDDNSALPAADFDTQFQQALLDAGQTANYIFHGVYSFTDPSCPSADPCCGGVFGQSLTASVGTVYRELADLTGGQHGNLCLQEQGFVSTFTAVSQQVVTSATLACEWVIPPPPAGETLDPNLVNVEFTPPGGQPVSYGRVDSAADCANVVDGWYYDNPVSPTQIFMCPQTCTFLQNAGPQSTMEIQFGCATVIAPPK